MMAHLILAFLNFFYLWVLKDASSRCPQIRSLKARIVPSIHRLLNSIHAPSSSLFISYELGDDGLKFILWIKETTFIWLQSLSFIS
mmetsp:Transcript_26580/g.70841  ORF Transcript_26580/g.70841 Transcript_26580/m.70841 type:complete len:86 (+) Transcript_26580:260-517(+)